MKKFIAFVLDFFIAFIGLGFIIAQFTGETNDGGFNLQGASAFFLFFLIILYVLICKKFLGQTLGQKIVGLEVKKGEESTQN